jgi:hypothetical protein
VLYLAQRVTRMKLTQKLNFKPNCATRGSCTLVTVANVLEPNVVPRALKLVWLKALNISPRH